jgi:predicted DNA-binding transcriptional regulator AlpA
MKNRPVRVRDLAERIGVDVSTVRRWLANGDGPPHIKTPGGHIIFDDPEALDQWIESLRGPASAIREPRPDEVEQGKRL